MTPGTAFRTAILEKYEPEGVAALTILDMAAETLDECHELKKAIEEGGYQTEGPKGRNVANALLRELRAHRKAFTDLAEQVEPSASKSETRRAASALGRARWAK
ncbi:MAG TPA: hypothetical protein VGL16_14915 [Actinomycetota bacterium]|jgi:hypothetical protein